MSHTKRRSGLLTALAVGLLATLIPAVPTADAAVAPWTWKRVTQNFTVASLTSAGVRAVCPANYTAITGGLFVPLLASVRPHGQYREDDGSGSGWTVNFRNFSGASVNGSVVAECVETADLPPISFATADFAQDGNGFAEGTVNCPSDGQLALTGGVDWGGSATNRELLASMPPSSTSAWYGYGYNPTSADLTVEVYCVAAANIPSLTRAGSLPRTGTGWYTETATCPVGMRILNGGMFPSSFASYPSLTSWTSTIYRDGSESPHAIRATCIDAGSPTVNLTFTSPGPSGSQTNTGNAGFSMSGTDPAGYPNNFICAIDGGPYSDCNGGADYAGLSSGPHEFEVLNTTPDGRTGSATYTWTVDTVAPTVTKPKLPKVTLAASTEAKWRGSDVHTGVDHYQATYRLLRADGTATAWTTPAEWMSIGRTVQTPAIEQGQTVCVAARSFDEVGNVSPWSAPSCTTRPFDDSRLDATAGWNRLTGQAFWMNTLTRTSASGQTLSRNDVHLSRVGILASVCNGCGSVVVKVGDTRIGRINLDAAAAGNRKVRLLPAFTATSDVVTIRSVTSGRAISVDGLIPIQASALLPFN